TRWTSGTTRPSRSASTWTRGRLRYGWGAWRPTRLTVDDADEGQLGDARIHHQADRVDDSGAVAGHPDDVLDDEADQGESVPGHRTSRPRVDPAEPRPEVPPRQALVGAVPVLRAGHGAPRPGPVARTAQPGRQRRHQGALPDVDQARPDGHDLRDRRRDPARRVRRPQAQLGA